MTRHSSSASFTIQYLGVTRRPGAPSRRDGGCLEHGYANNWIGGTWVDSSVRTESFDPATGDPIGTFADGGRAEAAMCVNAALRAFNESPWKDDRVLRAHVLNQLADCFEARRNELVAILALENGKIIPEAQFEVDMVPSKLRYWASAVRMEYGRAAEVKPGRLSYVLRSPVGVAGIIAPFNSPIVLMIRSLAPALAAGTTAAIKLPGNTAQTNFVMSDVMSEARDLPPGVINIFSESVGRGGSSFLVESPDVPVISFTGSTKTGRTISAAGAAHLKRFGLELGGKTPMIVFDDADLDAAAPVIEKALTTFAGQFCMTGSRLLVQRGVAANMREMMKARLGNVKVGPASDAASDMGPLIDKPNVLRVDKMVEEAIAAGAHVVLRGGPFQDGSLAKGAFYAPTLLEVTDANAPIMQQEVFGPVLTMMVFDSETEAIDIANNSEYGLCASIWTRDVDRPFRIARELNSGTVWINDWAVVYDEFEEGGFNQSGVGRLNGFSAMDDFLQYKHIAYNSGTVPR
jgi:betaine-aldehyde dehydrogenase